MGKFARAAAHVKNVTADPVATSGKFIGRNVKRAAVATKSTVAKAKDSVLSAEAEIAQDKANKAAFEAAIKAATVVENTPPSDTAVTPA